MLIFIDTEFSGFGKEAEILSLALVAEDGQEIYLENLDYTPAKCSAFVKKEVLHLIGKMPGEACSYAEMGRRLFRWLTDLSEPAVVVYDYGGDLAYLSGVLNGPVALRTLVSGQIHLEGWVFRESFFKLGMIQAYSRKLPLHHALADARALRNGYLTWRDHCVATVTKGSNSIDSALITLSDYPVLNELARVLTTATKLDGRACRHIYEHALMRITADMLTAQERRLIVAWGLMLNGTYWTKGEVP